jgi:hypothetical protein
MNYIRHLTAFFDRVVKEDRMNPTHISLYMSLFQFWNISRFVNPILISRNEMMVASKILSTATYHKVMKDLNEFGLIHYKPSYNPFCGSQVEMLNLEDEPVQGSNRYRFKKQTDGNQVIERYRANKRTPANHLNEPIYGINSINISNNKLCKQQANESTTLDFDQTNLQVKTETPSDAINLSESSTPGGGGPAAGYRPQATDKANRETLLPETRNLEPETRNLKPETNLPNSLEEVKAYFTIQKSTPLEAEKFFNHFQSNGWKVGGRSPMKDWQAAARNWILNGSRFNSENQIKNKLQVATIKNYAEPL